MRVLGVVGLAMVAAACRAEGATGADDHDVTVATGTRTARAQYDANVAFATSYIGQCHATGTRPRILVSGFGRFLNIADNATGRILAELTGVRYPETVEPATGQVDPPARQVSVAQTTLELPSVGTVDVCAMILPVDWDLASILLAREADTFHPSFVMMNGVAGDRQPLWIELGATNRAARLVDGTNLLVPAGSADLVPLVEDAPASEDARPNLLAWSSVRAAARAAVRRHANEVDGGERFGDLLPDADLAGFPRSSNTYLCNNTTYVTGFLMDHPQRPVSLLRASLALPGAANDVTVTMTSDLSQVPRVFVHWPSELADKHHAAAADVMRAIVDAQLGAAEPSTRGDNRQADPTLAGGAFF